jgi:hypothetical protein
LCCERTANDSQPSSTVNNSSAAPASEEAPPEQDTPLPEATPRPCLAEDMEAVGHLAMGLSPVVPVLVTTAVIAGIGNGLESVCGNSLLQRAAHRSSPSVWSWASC